MPTKTIKFSAKWCNPCKALAATMEKNGIHTTESHDVEENPELADKYGVRALPSILKVDVDTGEVVDKLVGVPSDVEVLRKFVSNE